VPGNIELDYPYDPGGKLKSRDELHQFNNMLSNCVSGSKRSIRSANRGYAFVVIDGAVAVDVFSSTSRRELHQRIIFQLNRRGTGTRAYRRHDRLVRDIPGLGKAAVGNAPHGSRLVLIKQQERFGFAGELRFEGLKTQRTHPNLLLRCLGCC
jgi:hypothetical protein